MNRFIKKGSKEHWSINGCIFFAGVHLIIAKGREFVKILSLWHVQFDTFLGFLKRLQQDMIAVSVVKYSSINPFNSWLYFAFKYQTRYFKYKRKLLCTSETKVEVITSQPHPSLFDCLLSAWLDQRLREKGWLKIIKKPIAFNRWSRLLQTCIYMFWMNWRYNLLTSNKSIWQPPVGHKTSCFPDV